MIFTVIESKTILFVGDFGVLLEYPTTTGFQWGYLKNGPYTLTQ